VGEEYRLAVGEDRKKIGRKVFAHTVYLFLYMKNVHHPFRIFHDFEEDKFSASLGTREERPHQNGSLTALIK